MSWHRGSGRKGAELRRRVGESQNWRCCYCGVRFVDEPDHKHSMTLDHVVPKSKGGSGGFPNLVAACRRCNGSRNDRDAEDYGERRASSMLKPLATLATLADVWPR